jgi:hypothetical protein
MSATIKHSIEPARYGRLHGLLTLDQPSGVATPCWATPPRGIIAVYGRKA